MKKMRIVAGLMALLMLLQFANYESVVSASGGGKVYYISAFGGDDDNDGLSENTPWKTLAKVSAQTFQPGDRILLKAGDVWTNETLILRSSGTAEHPIELTAYGEGGKPVISPQIVDASAIILVNTEGWKITGLELERAMMGINAEFDNVYDKNYLWFEDLYIHDMDDTYNSNPNKYNHFSAGIALMGNQTSSTYHLRNLTMKSIVFDNTNTPLWQGVISRYTNAAGFGINARFKDVAIDDLAATNTKQWGYNFIHMEDVEITNISAENVGVLGGSHDGVNPYGIGGIVVAYAKNVALDGVVLRNISKGAQGYDGVGFDFEGGLDTANVSLKNAVIDGTDGAGVMVFNNGGVGGTAGAYADNVAISNFGRNPGNSSGGVIFFPDSGTGKFSNFTIDRGASARPFIEGSSAGFELEKIAFTPEATEAEFVGVDGNLSGEWRSGYGRDGYQIEGGESKLPAYVRLDVTGNSGSVVWAADTDDRRAPTNARGDKRSAGAAVSDESGALTYELDMRAEGLTHKIALYMVDWNGEGHRQHVRVEDIDGNVLIPDTEIANFGEGQYFVLQAAGYVRLIVTAEEGRRAVASGIFFGEERATPIMTMSRTASKVQLDGDIQGEEWASAEPIALNYASQVENGPGSLVAGGPEADLNAEIRMMWDEFGIYVAGAVKDDDYFNPYQTGDPLNNNDTIQLVFDPLNKKTAGTDDAYIFDLVPTSGADHSGPATWYEHWKWGGADYRAGVKVAGKLTADGYSLEAYIPWDALRKKAESFVPGSGAQLGVGLLLVDFNGAGQLKGILTNFGRGANTIGDASTYRTIVLEEPGAIVDAVVSRGKPATALSYNTGFEPAKAVDGDDATYWVASNGVLPQWLQVDLGRPYSLNKIEQRFQTNDPWKYTIEGSLDGQTWTGLVDYTDNSVQGPFFAHEVAGTFRYVKLTMLAGWGNWATTAELKVYTDEALLHSTRYRVDEALHVVDGVPNGESVQRFLSGLAAVNATIGLFKADGVTPVSGGKVENGMKLVLQSTTGKDSVVYTIVLNEAVELAASFTVGNVANADKLAAGELLKGELMITNRSVAAKTVTLVVALYDDSGTDGAMTQFAYSTRTLASGETEKLTGGFKLPASIAGHRAKIFAVEGADLLAPSAILGSPKVLTP